ncbi:unnamed protein product, partial [Amoebophrya sp. A120]|eukprot:GSA120T00011547001.1
MRQCGNWQDCKCKNRRGTTFPVQCDGVVEISREHCVNNPPPPSCGAHHVEASICARYHFCPKNQCLIRNVFCQADDLCQGEGICIPSTGGCVFPNLPKGTPCDDSLFYTPRESDKCDGLGKCVGVPDLCELHNVKCLDADPACAVLPGTCSPDSGKCVYQFRQDSTICDDNRFYTVGDQCRSGLCEGVIVDLCANVECGKPANDPCRGDGRCQPATGRCAFPELP